MTRYPKPQQPEGGFTPSQIVAMVLVGILMSLGFALGYLING